MKNMSIEKWWLLMIYPQNKSNNTEFEKTHTERKDSPQLKKTLKTNYENGEIVFSFFPIDKILKSP